VNCATHPEEPITGTCERCGGFVCQLDTRSLFERTYCPACIGLPDVNYLEAFRLEVSGWADGFGSIYGFGGTVLNVALLLYALMPWITPRNAPPSGSEIVYSAIVGVWSAFSIAISLSYLAGRVWTRQAVFAPSSVFVALALSRLGIGGNGLAQVYPPTADALAFTVPLVTACLAWRSTANKLYFKLPVTEPALHRYWRVLRDNPIARQGFYASFFAFCVPGASVLTLVASTVGLARVDANARPPQGRRGQAIAGIVLSLAGLVFWAVVLSRHNR
jgi:hypothetical protein